MSEKAEKDKKLLSTQYAELHRYTQNEEYERAIKSANRILGLSPQEFAAFHCKIICLIQLSKFEEALQLLNKYSHFSINLVYEKAYCYYRVNKHEDALKVIDGLEGELDDRFKELKAQVLYRLEKYEASSLLYRDIIKNISDDYEDERYTNLSASLVYLDNEDTRNRIDDLRDNTYELCYNKACILITQGLYNEAEKKLKQCEKLCREMLEEEETSEEEIDIELALIRIQLGYVYQKQGRIKEAQQIYTTNLKLKLDDIALTAVASNNLVAINKDQNLFDSKKKMKTALNDALIFKLPSRQRKYIALNNAILNYYIRQTDQCERSCKLIEKIWPELSIYSIILKSLNLVKGDNTAQAIDFLKKFKPKNPTDSLYLHLTIAQLYLVQGNKIEACKVLENLGEDSYKPGIVGALTTLYLGLNDEEKALKVFEKSVDWYKRNNVKDVNLTSMWRQAAEFHIKNGHPQVAANSLEELLKTNKNDKKITAQLVLAYSQFDKKRALQMSKHLPSIRELSGDIDMEALQLTANQTSFKKSPAIKPDSLPGTPHSDSEKRRKHKKRKGKLPKNYIEGATPDPERWLPKYERTGYRRKRDRRVKEVIKGSQGTASGQSDQYDFSKHVEQDDSPVVETTKIRSTPHQQKRTQPKKKNKRR